jgi:hypothetical protein
MQCLLFLSCCDLNYIPVDLLILQYGIITDGDGAYTPDVDDCTWTVAPPGATKIFLTFTKLSLGGNAGNDDEQLEIVTCESIACNFPENIPRSPFSQHSPSLEPGW